MCLVHVSMIHKRVCAVMFVELQNCILTKTPYTQSKTSHHYP